MECCQPAQQRLARPANLLELSRYLAIAQVRVVAASRADDLIPARVAPINMAVDHDRSPCSHCAPRARYLGQEANELQVASWLHNTEHSVPAVAVFSGSQPGACGQAVSKPVDNRRQMGTTTRFPWIYLWIAEKPEMAGRGLLRGSRRGSRNVLTVRKRASPGVDPGNVGGAGRPVPCTGTWPRRAARCASRAGQLASRCGEAGPGPSISYMEGPRLILPGPDVPAGTAGNAPPRRSAVMTGYGRGP